MINSINAETRGSLNKQARNDCRIVKLKDIVEVKNELDRNPEKTGFERYLKVEHLDANSLKIKRWGLIKEGDLPPTFYKVFRKGQVLYPTRNPHLRRTAFADFDGICGEKTLTLQANEDMIITELLPFIFQQETFIQYASSSMIGSTNPHVRWRDLAEYQFALPPKDKQRRIADILWAAEKEKEVLSNAFVALQKLNSTVGMETFKRKPTKRVLLGELVANGVLEFQTGPFGTVLKASSYVAEGTPIINPVNMVNGKLVTNDGPFLSYEECTRLSRYRMQEGDIILGRKGEMGRIIYVTHEYEGFIAGSDCIRIRLNTEELHSSFLYYLLISPQARKWLTRQASGTTMPGVNEKILAGFEVPIPDIGTQHEIVGLFQSIDEGVKTLQAKLEKHSTLSKFLLNRLLSHELI